MDFFPQEAALLREETRTAQVYDVFLASLVRHTDGSVQETRDRVGELGLERRFTWTFRQDDVAMQGEGRLMRRDSQLFTATVVFPVANPVDANVIQMLLESVQLEKPPIAVE